MAGLNLELTPWQEDTLKLVRRGRFLTNSCAYHTGRTHAALIALMVQCATSGKTETVAWPGHDGRALEAIFKRHGISCTRYRDTLTGEFHGLKWKIIVAYRKEK